MNSEQWMEIKLIMSKPDIMQHITKEHILCMYRYIDYKKAEDDDSINFAVEAVVKDYLGIEHYGGTA